jgi:hypothetical protein
MNYENFNKIKWRVNDAISNRCRGRLQDENYLLKNYNIEGMKLTMSHNNYF